MVESHRILAWAGWKMRIPSAWYPLQITGAHEAGAMIVGNSEMAMLQIKWRIAHPPRNASRWAADRAKHIIKHPDIHRCDVPKGFDGAHLASDDSDLAESGRIVWCGAAISERLMLEIVMNGSAGKAAVKSFAGVVLPSITVANDNGMTAWSIFDASFEVPSDAKLISRRLYAGDIMLSMGTPKGRKILLRQIYPATLALERRPMESWLADNTVRRTIRRINDMKISNADIPGMKGLSRAGMRRLPPPLSVFGERHTMALIAHDTGRNRLLMAAEESPAPVEQKSIHAFISRMNIA